MITEPPFQVSESGYGSFIVSIEVHFRMKESGQRSMQTYNHDLTLPAEGNPPIELALTEKLTFTLVSEDFIEMVLKGGGVSWFSFTVILVFSINKCIIIKFIIKVVLKNCILGCSIIGCSLNLI